MPTRVLAGPPLDRGAESLRDHLARLGPLPPASGAIAELDASGLLGRGGAGFPAGTKWRSVAERGRGDARVLANGAEGEPLSSKDRAVMSLRPHLVLDGAILAAAAVGATEVVLYVGAEHRQALGTLAHALRERAAVRRGLPVRVTIVEAPVAYVAGEESAAVHFVNAGDARPTTVPPRPFESGIDGRPTLVQNVETLAHAALIARRGAGWYRERGSAATPGTALVTVTGGERPGVREIDLGTTVAEVADAARARLADTSAVLLGGYFGSWVRAAEAWDVALDPLELRERGRAFGAGIVAFLPTGECGVRVTARIMAYMAAQSAAQCGPCVFGLRAIGDAVERIATGAGRRGDLARLERWGQEIVGRGACRHPDGAAGHLASALDVFGDEFRLHVATGRCSARTAGRAA